MSYFRMRGKKGVEHFDPLDRRAVGSTSDVEEGCFPMTACVGYNWTREWIGALACGHRDQASNPVSARPAAVWGNPSEPVVATQ
jgi:hypothetical protein